MLMENVYRFAQVITQNEAAALRQAIEQAILAAGGNADATADMILALNEAVVNSLRHGYQEQPGLVEIEVWRQAQTLVVHLRDSAPLFDPTLSPTPDTTRPLTSRPLGGMGIHMMRNFTDELHYQATRDGRNQVTLIKYHTFPQNLPKLHKGETMDISIENVNLDKPVTILELQGDLDGKSYLALIAQVQDLYADGVRRLVLDLSGVKFMSSAGLVGLHTAAMVMRGQSPPSMEGGWSVIHEVTHEMGKTSAFDPNTRLLNPQPRVKKTLDMTGFSRILEVFSDRETAVTNFP